MTEIQKRAEKEVWQEEDQPQKEGKKKLFSFSELKKENFVVILLLGILLLVIAWPVSDEKTQNKILESRITDSESSIIEEKKENVSSFTDKEETQDWQSYVSYLERTLEELLSTMEGAGKVKVMVTLKDSGEAVVEKDITTETGGTTQVDGTGSNNTSDRYEIGETVFESAGSGISIPYVKQVISPRIEGVVVSVQGGDNLQVNKNITEAIQALFGIDVHKIKIIKMSSNS